MKGKKNAEGCCHTVSCVIRGFFDEETRTYLSQGYSKETFVFELELARFLRATPHATRINRYFALSLTATCLSLQSKLARLFSDET